MQSLLIALALTTTAPTFDPHAPLPCVVTNETCQHACKARPHVGGCRFGCAGREMACFVTPTSHRAPFVPAAPK